jgi:hypothetical protein
MRHYGLTPAIKLLLVGHQLEANMTYTTHEIELAKRGYCYGRKGRQNGLRPIINVLTGKERGDLIFDHDAYAAHKEFCA